MPVWSAALDVVDWRRRTFALYAEVRAARDPATGHELWGKGRDDLFAEHPASPVLPADRAGFRGLPVAPYDPAWRFEVPVEEPAEDAPAETWTVETGTDGTVTFERVGVVRLPGLGSLDVWRLTSYGGGLFVPLRDGSSGRTTYGGGRYVLDTIKGADLGGEDDALVVDLNFAYAHRPARTTPRGPVRWRQRATRWPRTFRSGSCSTSVRTVEELAGPAFLVAAAAHAGFQATVTLVVYPTLAHVRAAHWRQAHDRHSRAIAPLVGVLYVALLATGAWWLAVDRSPLPVLAAVLALLTTGVTAAVAVPLHRRLVRRDDTALRRLLVADRVRTALAVAATAVALVAVAR